MEADSGTPSRVTVVIERGAGRVFVAGQEVVLPPTEFRLLLALAETPGEATPVTELIEAVWGRDSHMSRPDLYWLVWSLRGRIGDEQRQKKVVANRKGHGYLIDLTTVELEVVDVIGEAPASAASLDSETTPGSQTAVLGRDHDDRPTNEAAASAMVGVDANGVSGGSAGEDGALRPASQVFGGSAAATDGPQATRPRPRLLLAGCVVAASLALGFAARTLVDDTPKRSPARVAQAVASPTPDPSPEARKRPSEPDRERRKTSRHSPPRRGSGGGGLVLAAPRDLSVPSSTGSSPGGGGVRSVPDNNERAKPRPPQLPPPPTRYLYHLYNPENGDHLVTTDGGVVTEHEAKGYEGGAIGRVYVTQEKDTYAIPTNLGTAYVFAHASPKTDPDSSVVALWLAQKGGDFFYTTSKAEATKDGWSASPSGYVRTL